MPQLSDRVGTFTDSVIRRMTRINNQYDSINLSQGFPDFDPPKPLLDALEKGRAQRPAPVCSDLRCEELPRCAGRSRPPTGKAFGSAEVKLSLRKGRPVGCRFSPQIHL